jgi:hypothetical protein
MQLRLVFHPDAELEFAESYIWYDEKSDGLGESFRNCVNTVLNNIKKYPLHHPKKKLNFREVLVPAFPFVIVYEIIEKRNLIHIASIFHGKRNPKLKYRKFQNTK